MEFWGRWPEVSVAGIRACRNGGSRTRGQQAQEPRLLPELPPAPDAALWQPPVLVEHWEAGASLSTEGRGQVIPIQIL